MIRELRSQLFPVQLAQGLPLHQQGTFRVASGATIPNLGRVMLPTIDAYGCSRRMKGNVTEVGKPLLSAGEVSKAYDSFLFRDGGILIPRDSALGRQVQDAVWKLISSVGARGCIDLHRENNVYNAYFKVGKATLDNEQSMLAPVAGDDRAAGSTAPEAAEWGRQNPNGRQAAP